MAIKVYTSLQYCGLFSGATSITAATPSTSQATIITSSNYDRGVTCPINLE